jgi:gliding motility-associated-like protein
MIRLFIQIIFFLLIFVGSPIFSLAQTTVDFNEITTSTVLSLNGTDTYDNSGVRFQIFSGTNAGANVSSASGGFGGTRALDDTNTTIGGVTGWKITKVDGSAFQLTSIWLQNGCFECSANGTIKAFSGGVQVGATVNVDFDSNTSGAKNFAANPDFYNIDEIRIEGTDLYVFIDNFSFGPAIDPVDGDPPVVTSISLAGTPLSTATSVNYTVDFSKDAKNVSSDDFQIITAGTTGTVGAVSGSGSSYTVVVNGIDGEGSIRLDLKAGTDIANMDDITGTPAFISGQLHYVGACFMETFETETDASAAFSGNGVNFSLGTGLEIEKKTGFGAGGSNGYVMNNNTAGSFSLTSTSEFTMSTIDLYLSNTANSAVPTANGTITITGKNGGEDQFTITKNSGFPTTTTVNGGFFTVNFSTDGAANYRNTNVDEIVFTISGGFIELAIDNMNFCEAAPDVDSQAPRLISSIPDGTVFSTATLVGFNLVFDENALNVSSDDFVTFTTGTATGSISDLTGSGSQYVATVSGISGEGSIRVDLASGNDIQDAISNTPSPAFTSGQAHLVGACFIETFEDETNGSTSFSGNSLNFNLTGNWTASQEAPSTGIGGSKLNLKNTGAGPYSINSPDKKITVNQVALFLSSLSSGNTPTNDGTVTIKGFNGASEEFSITKSAGFNTSFIQNSGYTLIDFSTESGQDNSNTSIDRLEITLGGSFVYLNLDNFEWCQDTTPPVPNAASLADITAQCQVTSLISPTATDNSGGTVTVTNDVTLPIIAQGTTVITWTFDDGNGNTSTQSQNVIIDDTTPPMPGAASLPDITAQCEVTSLSPPTATDNCGATVIVTNNATFPITSSTTITWGYDDGNGNITFQNQDVVITDTTAPVPDVASLPDITAQCQVTSLTPPTAIDNCGGTVTVTNNVTLPIIAQGTTVVTWTFDDGNGNTSSQSQNVIIDDTTPPTPDEVALPTVRAQCAVTSLIVPTAADNCGGNVTITNNATLPITASTTVTWAYNDGNGNITFQNQTIEIDDTTPPAPDLATLPDVTAQCQVTSLIPPAATDNCGGTVTVTNNATLPIITQGTTVVTWTFDDGNGNTSTQSQNVIIDDTTPPTPGAASLPDITAQCEVTSLPVPNVTDNCGFSVTVTKNVTLPITKSTTITWAYTDENGNITFQNQNVVITDTTVPVPDVASLPDITAQCQVTSLTPPTATDNCGGTVTVTKNVTLPIIVQGTTVVTWTFDDGNGNTSTQSQNVIIDDTTPPTPDAVALPTVRAQCAVTSLTVPTATDNCGGTVIVTNNATLPVTASTTVTWAYNDGNGNITFQNQDIVIDDTIAPVIRAKATISLSVDAFETVSLLPGMVDEGSTDNCEIQTQSFSKSVFDRTDEGLNSIQYTVTDVAGNSSQTTVQVTINLIPKALEIVANPGQNKFYGEPDPILTYTATGFEGGDDESIFSGSLAREVGEAVGSYAINQGSLDAGMNYTINFTGATFEIISNDRDKDGVPDDVEERDGTDPMDPMDYKDEDGDEVPDYTEEVQGTDPTDPGDYLDTDGDDVPDYVEEREGTDPDNESDAKDSDNDGIPDYVQDRSIVEYLAQSVTLAWGTLENGIGLSSEVLGLTGRGEFINVPVSWNLTGYNPYISGTNNFTGTAVLPTGILNTYGINPVIAITIAAKPVPQDVTLSANSFLANPEQFFQEIGDITVVDPSDDMHTLLLPDGMQDNGFFELVDGVLFWSSAEQAKGRTQFTVHVLVTDRAGNMLEKNFQITRTRTPLDELEVPNTFTPNNDRVNDSWGVPALRFYEGVQIEVFEIGSGKRVFYVENPDIRWDGSINGKDPVVTAYVWVISVKETGEVRRGILNLLIK